jgi:hypothetical protein
VKLENLKQPFKGARFGELVLQHYCQFDAQHITTAFLGTKDLLPQPVQNKLEAWIDEFGPKSRTTEFWVRDCSETLADICGAAGQQLSQSGATATDENLFNMFQLLVLNFAYSCHKHESNRMFIQKALGQGLFRRYFNLT